MKPTGRLGALDELLDDPAITEVMVNGPGIVWVDRAGRLEPSGIEIARIVDSEGSSIAFPSVTTYLARDAGLPESEAPPG